MGSKQIVGQHTKIWTTNDNKWSANATHESQQMQHMKVSKYSSKWTGNTAANTTTNGHTWKSYEIENMEGVVGVVGGNMDENIEWFVTHIDFRFTCRL